VLTDSPIEVLNSNRIAQLVKEIRSTYMNVIVDVPPVIPVSDPLLIGKLVDNVVFVVKAGYTSRVIAKRALDMLYDIGVTVDGLVLNNMHNVLPYYYDHRYYGYKYFENSEVVLD
jgi:Mrp family chromosome partitioning ATPase